MKHGFALEHLRLVKRLDCVGTGLVSHPEVI